MLEKVPGQVDHLFQLCQMLDVDPQSYINDVRNYAERGFVQTWIDHKGVPIAMGGVYPYATDPQRGHAWSVIRKDVKISQWGWLLNAARSVLIDSGFERIDALCADNKAVRTVVHLGFVEKYMSQFGMLCEWRRGGVLCH